MVNHLVLQNLNKHTIMKSIYSFIIVSLFLAMTILGLALMNNSKQIENNGLLVNHLHHRLEYQDSILAIHDVMFLTLLEDPFIAEVWRGSIHNPNNQPFVLECAFNLGIPIDSVTQEQFNHRYLFKE